ncbi:MAG: ISKra4 family transposase [Elainella sp.]
MKLETSIAEQLSQLKLFADGPQPVEEAVEQFQQAWRELGRHLLETQLQAQVETVEAQYPGARQRRTRHYQTPLGRIALKRRIYGSRGGKCWADERLDLPTDGWMRTVKELATALGVSSEFAQANRLLQHWSGVAVSEKTLANHVESYGVQLQQQEAAQPPQPVCPIASTLTQAVCPQPKRPVLYIGADGIHTPLQRGTTAEAKVGVLFFESDHWRLCETRKALRAREYIATLEGVAGFSAQLHRCYESLVQQRPHQVVFLGDGAAWIWRMAALLFPDCIEILDFFHLSEYLWEVARAAFANQEAQQKQWVETAQQWLKQSQPQQVVEAVGRLPPGTSQLIEARDNLLSYLHHNQQRIDYQRYLQLGLMIGSGVVESSNRRIVTQRLKHSGMFWSRRGAQAVMGLRACYLSSSSRWHNFWYKQPIPA